MGEIGINQGLIARRLFVQIFLLSLIATVVISALQLHFRYRDKLRFIEEELRKIETSHLNSISANLWLMDETLMRTELEGILNLPNIQFVEVRGVEGQRIALGAPETVNRIEREYPLLFSHRGRETELGKFTIHANLGRIWTELLEEAAALSMGEAGKIFVTAFLAFILFQVTVGRHLRSLALQAQELDLGRLHSPFNLHRPSRKGKTADELEYLISALNALYGSLTGSIETLHHANEKLDQEIEERKRTEQALRQANLVVENSPVVLFRWKAVEGWPVEMVSQNVSQFGYTQEELLSGAIPFAALVHHEDLDRVGREVREYAAIGTDRFQKEYRIVTRDGGVRWVDDRTVVERNGDGQIAFYQGLVIDITERKRVEEALRFTQFAIDKTIDQAFWMTEDGYFFYVNDAACRTLGYSREELLKLSVPDIGPTFPPEAFARHWRDLQKNGSATFESFHRTKDGRVYPVEIRANYVVFDGKEYNCAFATDITERRRAEELLRENMTRLQTLVSNVPIVIYGIDRRGVFTLSEGKGLTAMGLKPGEVVGQSVFDVYRDHPEDLQNFRRALAGEAFTVPVRAGKHIYDAYHEPVFGEDGEYAGTLGVLVDVTERNLSEEKLRASEVFLETIIEYSPFSMWVSDNKGTLIRMNQACRVLLHVDDEDLVGKYNLFKDNIVEKQGAMPLVKRVFERGERARFTLHYDSSELQSPRLRKTTQLVLEVTISPVLDTLGQVVHAIIQHQDMTERRQAEEALRTSLVEKESLLKEVHHRVKNNLQVISSLLNLQSRKVQNPEVHGFLRDTQNRVRSMALLHETLYRSGNFSKISFPQYVKSICAHLARSYASDAERIRLRHDIADVALDLDQAIPAGLIVSELVANAFKHAFPTLSGGEILVALQVQGEHHLVLRVSDNGVGLPVEISPQSTDTLGLLLVRNLSQQLDGRMSVISEQGTVFEIVFPAKSI